MQILDKLWNGTLYPQNIDFSQNSQYPEMFRRMNYSMKALTDSLDDSQQELFEAYMEKERELSEITDYEIFAQGFQMGVKMMVDVVNKEVVEEE